MNRFLTLILIAVSSGIFTMAARAQSLPPLPKSPSSIVAQAAQGISSCNGCSSSAPSSGLSSSPVKQSSVVVGSSGVASSPSPVKATSTGSSLAPNMVNRVDTRNPSPSINQGTLTGGKVTVPVSGNVAPTAQFQGTPANLAFTSQGGTQATYSIVKPSAQPQNQPTYSIVTSSPSAAPKLVKK